VDALIAAGHPPAVVWTYTPRRLAGFLDFAARRQKREAANTLALHATAARADGKDINARLKELAKE
jgi:hypothetical protein